MTIGLTANLGRCLFVLAALHFSCGIQAENDYLSIKFSKKNQLKTGMVWMQFKPKLILAKKQRKNWFQKVTGNDQKPKQVHTSAAKKNEESLPQAAVGKLFYTKSDGQIANCSAAFAGGPDIIVTAAHCVMSANGDWNGNFLFIRSYGSEHHDVYAIECIATPGEWGERSGDLLGFDYAFLRANRIATSGNLDITDRRPPSRLMLIGYSDSHRNGRKMMQLDVRVIKEAPGRVGSRKHPMGAGSSGSPWLAQKTVYSVSSYYNADEQGVMWGPRLSENTLHLASYTRNGCEDSNPI
ncbi:MAG: V8-like Glu-specific endopeptidase [Candidatus Azotimanducaceae bacterium]|jgi:V8-like Glu-specific endopeptidase